MQEHFSELALLLIIAAACGALALRLRQPVLIAYILVGVIAGPAVFGLVTAHDQIDLLAQMGIAVLLFLVGLKLDLAHVRHIGPVALATGLGQLGFTIAVGFVLVLLLGRTPLEALYVAVALTFSSTIKQLGVPTVIYPMRNAVDFVVDSLTGIIRCGRDERQSGGTLDREKRLVQTGG